MSISFQSSGQFFTDQITETFAALSKLGGSFTRGRGAAAVPPNN
jgi:hypothetical protein